MLLLCRMYVLSYIKSCEGRNVYYLWSSRSQGSAVARLQPSDGVRAPAGRGQSFRLIHLCRRERFSLSVAQSWMCWPTRLPPRWPLQRNIKLGRGPRESDAMTWWMAPDLHEHLANEAFPFNMQYNRERIVNPLLSCWAQWSVWKPFIWQLC